jgi:hypothetical protein
VAGLRWVEDGSYTDLRDGAGRLLGSVRRSARPGRGWWAWSRAGRRGWSGYFPDRAAAVRAVECRADPNRGEPG